MNQQQGLQQIEKTRIIAILRGVPAKDISQTAQALLMGGIKVIEITLNTPGALNMIRQLQKELGDHMYIGAGTVLDQEDLHQALEAGASFIVSPNTDEQVIEHAVKQGVPIYPGAMTPTEIVKAWKAGAAAVKIFPSASLGLPYLKELQGPLGGIPMIAVGGVEVSTLQDYLKAGCYAVGIGGSLINLAEIAKGNYSFIKEKARQFTEQTKAYHASL
ncbi:MAG TPA: bifunctional 4-hydroxy-2-oxoglutarate aldolase/2-dehydro-3-deoxy-phosphogluconate aldolase [Bacilli bacterium]